MTAGCETTSIPRWCRSCPPRLKPGDSLVSTISMPKGLKLRAPLWHEHRAGRGRQQSGPHRRRADLRGPAAAGRRLPPGLLRPPAEDLSGAEPQARVAPHGGRGQGHALPGAIRPLHAAALGGHLFLRLRGAGGEHAAIRAGLRPRGGHLRLAAVHRSEARSRRSRCW